MEAVINILNLILLVAVVIIFLRLRSVLGTDADSDPARRDILKPREKGRSKREKEQAPPVDKPTLRVVSDGETAHASGGLHDIAQADDKFDGAKFLAGAAQAYEIIVLAYAANDHATLKPLVGADVFAGFAQAMDARAAAGQVLETTFLKLNPATIADAVLDGKAARVTVQVESEVISVLRDKAGAVVEGSPELVVSNRDLWTFERNVKSKNLNWTLIATENV